MRTTSESLQRTLAIVTVSGKPNGMEFVTVSTIRFLAANGLDMQIGSLCAL